MSRFGVAAGLTAQLRHAKSPCGEGHAGLPERTPGTGAIRPRRRIRTAAGGSGGGAAPPPEVPAAARHRLRSPRIGGLVQAALVVGPRRVEVGRDDELPALLLQRATAAARRPPQAPVLPL